MSRAPLPVIDPVELCRDLIRRPSVTPADAGAMDVLEEVLTRLGFVCRRMRFEDIENLYARRGTAGPNLCFAGHTDVVPVGAEAQWSAGPFDGEVRDGVLFGRGAVDMKGGIAAWVAAVSRVLAQGRPMQRAVAKLGRNDLCHCGSGKKYKRCCFEKDDERLHFSTEVAGKTLVVFNTADTPPERESGYFGDPLEAIWLRCIAGLCGIERVERRVFGVVVTSTPQERAAWLDEVRQILTDLFPAN